MFKLIRHPPSNNIDMISRSIPPDHAGPPSERALRHRLTRYLEKMFTSADIRLRVAQHSYKAYYGKSVRLTPTITPGDSVYIYKPPTEPKTAQEKSDGTARSKLLLKTHTPFTVITATPDKVTIHQDGIKVRVSIDRCTEHPTSNDINYSQGPPAQQSDKNEN